MVSEYFLGANTGDGFYSLYDGFGRGEDDFLHVIKGGPGTGKSGYMRRIGALAEAEGLDVEYILCSGDPDSLDGVYLPELGLGWADGTAPHVMDPAFFGASGDYENLGAFCDTAATRAHRKEIEALTRLYRGFYDRAYACLRAAEAAAPERRAGLVTDVERARAAVRARAAAERELPRRRGDAHPGRVTRRFLSAFTCRGMVFLSGTLAALCRRVYALDDRYGLAEPFLETLLSEARARGVDAVLCPDPLEPERPQAVLLPALSLGFLALRDDLPAPENACRHLRLDALVPAERVRAQRKAVREEARIRRALLAQAQDALQSAKALHDRLEALYNPHVDFAAVRFRADETFRRLTAPGP